MGSVRAVWANRRTRQTGRAHHRGSVDFLDWRLNAQAKNPQSQAKKAWDATPMRHVTFQTNLTGITVFNAVKARQILAIEADNGGGRAQSGDLPCPRIDKGGNPRKNRARLGNREIARMPSHGIG